MGGNEIALHLDNLRFSRICSNLRRQNRVSQVPHPHPHPPSISFLNEPYKA